MSQWLTRSPIEMFWTAKNKKEYMWQMWIVDVANEWEPDWINKIQGLSERMAKVICLVKTQFSHKLSFLCCFRSRISDKFIPFSIQVQHDQPKASKKVCASNVLSGPGRLLQANHWLWDSGQRSKLDVSVCEGQTYRCEQRWICSNCKNFPLIA